MKGLAMEGQPKWWDARAVRTATKIAERVQERITARLLHLRAKGDNVRTKGTKKLWELGGMQVMKLVTPLDEAPPAPLCVDLLEPLLFLSLRGRSIVVNPTARGLKIDHGTYPLDHTHGRQE